MAQPELRLPPNRMTIVMSCVVMLLAIWGLFQTETVPWIVSVLFILMALYAIFQLKRIILNSSEIRIKTILTGKSTHIQKAEINTILMGLSSNNKHRIITLRTHSKKTLVISTMNLDNIAMDKAVAFFEKYYADKLH
jgi:hypothetical protein